MQEGIFVLDYHISFPNNSIVSVTMDAHNEERMEEAYDEAELSDDEFAELSFGYVDRVESNSPSLTNLRVLLLTLVQNNDDDRHRLDRLATAISRNTQLKALMFNAGGAWLDDAHAMNFLRGIACNQSIKRIHFNDCGERFHVGNACRILTPLFKRNQVERIQIWNCNLVHELIGLLATSLTEFDSLKEFALKCVDLQDNPESEQVVRELVQSLSGHSRLRKLDLSNTEVGKLGCSALVDLLSNPNISLKVLDPLNNSSCRLERINLGGNTINDAAAQPLSDALASSTTLKTLNLSNIRGITITGWHVLFDFLRSQTCALEDLDLSSNELNDEVMVSLTDALASNRSLKSLNLNTNDGFTGAAWQRFFSTVLANPSSGLEKLDLGYCDINNAAIRSLPNALVNNNTLKVLTLYGNNQFTDTGWETFSSVLESPYTALEKLDLRDNDVDDATLTSLVNSLANNKNLKEFRFDYSYDWGPPLSVVCNTDSIVSTYNSNHILETLGCEDEWPEEFESLLQINRENSPSQASRLKIIKTHFNKGFVTQPFVDMDLNVQPHAMAWMGRGGRAGEVDGHYFSFIQSISSLFESAN